MPDFSIEKNFSGPVIGLDEVGRGPLAGPVISCGCYFKNYIELKEYEKFIVDSKKLSSKNRILSFNFFKKLQKKKILEYHLGIGTVKEIDSINILESTKLSMKRAIDKFKLNNF